MEGEMKEINTESAEGRIKSIQYNTLKTRYMDIFKRSNLELENFKDIQKDRLEAQLRAKGVRVTDEELVALLEEKADIQLFTDNVSSLVKNLQEYRPLHLVYLFNMNHPVAC